MRLSLLILLIALAFGACKTDEVPEGVSPEDGVVPDATPAAEEPVVEDGVDGAGMVVYVEEQGFWGIVENETYRRYHPQNWNDGYAALQQDSLAVRYRVLPLDYSSAGAARWGRPVQIMEMIELPQGEDVE